MEITRCMVPESKLVINYISLGEKCGGIIILYFIFRMRSGRKKICKAR